MDEPGQQRMDALNMAIIGHLVGAKRDMSQIQGLLREAVDNLLDDTFAIREACRNQQAVIGDGSEADWPQAPQAAELNREIDQRVDATLRHLQFQDMVCQLLDHIRINLEAVEALAFSGSGVNADADERGSDYGDGPALSARSKPVQSHSMQAGDIELF
jgi:hypothetical protein